MTLSLFVLGSEEDRVSAQLIFIRLSFCKLQLCVSIFPLSAMNKQPIVTVGGKQRTFISGTPLQHLVVVWGPGYLVNSKTSLTYVSPYYELEDGMRYKFHSAPGKNFHCKLLWITSFSSTKRKNQLL